MENIKTESADRSRINSLIKEVESGFKQKLLYHGSDACDRLQFASTYAENIQDLEPMLYYEKYYREKHTIPEVVDKIIELSDKEQIKKYDALVDEFNSDLERIKKESDSSRVTYFLNNFEKIIGENKTND